MEGDITPVWVESKDNVGWCFRNNSNSGTSYFSHFAGSYNDGAGICDSGSDSCHSSSGFNAIPFQPATMSLYGRNRIFWTIQRGNMSIKQAEAMSLQFINSKNFLSLNY